jgi:IclR family transcriptional regulator, KDG regulon repressor
MAIVNTDPGSQTVSRALTLLRCFSADEPTRSLTELSDETGLTVPTTHRLLKTLTARRFLVLDRTTKRYSLGPAVMQLAGAIMHRGNLQAEALPRLAELRRRSGETAALHGLVDEERVCLLEFVSHLPIRMSSGVGRRYPLHHGAAGRAILAHLPDEERDGYLTEHLEALGRPRADVEAELVECRERGYALSHGEVVEGATAVAVPIRNLTGYPVAAINVTGPDDRWTLDRATAFSAEILQVVEEIEQQLGFAFDT